MEPNQETQPTPQKRLPSWLTTVTPFSKYLAMALFILLPFTGFYLGIKYQEKVTVIPPVVSEIQKTTIQTPTHVSTAGWKTFTDKFVGFGFAIKYPSDYYQANSGGTGAVTYIADSANTVNNTYFAGKTLQNNQLLITIVSVVEAYPNMQKLANRIAGGTQQDVPFSIVNIAGQQAVKVIYNNVESYGIIPNSKNLTWISAQPATSIQIQTFETMMSSFKFTE
jgi:hypothetical protein